jgi:hypothetical protein
MCEVVPQSVSSYASPPSVEGVYEILCISIRQVGGLILRWTPMIASLSIRNVGVRVENALPDRAPGSSGPRRFRS